MSTLPDVPPRPRSDHRDGVLDRDRAVWRGILWAVPMSVAGWLLILAVIVALRP